MQKIEFARYFFTEKKIIASILIVAGVSLVFLMLTPSPQDNTNSKFWDLQLSDKPIIDRILVAEGYTFSGLFFLLANTWGHLILGDLIMKASPAAFLGIFSVYSLVCIPVILTRREIKLKRRIIYAYFSSTQFSLLPVALLSVAGL